MNIFLKKSKRIDIISINWSTPEQIIYKNKYNLKHLKIYDKKEYKKIQRVIWGSKKLHVFLSNNNFIIWLSPHRQTVSRWPLASWDSNRIFLRPFETPFLPMTVADSKKYDIKSKEIYHQEFWLQKIAPHNARSWGAENLGIPPNFLGVKNYLKNSKKVLRIQRF